MLFTAVSICCVYAAECREKSDRAYRESATLVNFRFRDELQYRGMRGYDSSRVNFVDETENFNYDGEMEKYDYTVNMTRDYFDRFAGSDEVENYNLSYIEKVYSTAYEVNSGKNESRPFALVGGKIDNFLSFRNEFFLNGYYSLFFLPADIQKPANVLYQSSMPWKTDSGKAASSIFAAMTAMSF